MATEVQTNQPTATSQQSVGTLVGGIVSDAQELLKQHVELLRTEVKEDLRKTKQAALLMAIGLVVASVGSLLLCFTLVYLLHWAFAPNLLLWHAYAIVAGGFLLVGGGLMVMAWQRFRSFNPLPDQTLEEIQWTIKPK
jgi:uncharacterized membrane protein YqjE